MGAIDSGNTAWILTSASLVFLMTPGVAFFYGGMVRAKAVLNMLMLEAAALSVTMIIWTLWGWSIAYAGSDIGGIFGDPASGFLLKDSMVAQDGVFTATGLNGNNYPVSVDVAFQVAFAMITVVALCGALATGTPVAAWATPVMADSLPAALSSAPNPSSAIACKRFSIAQAAISTSGCLRRNTDGSIVVDIKRSNKANGSQAGCAVCTWRSVLPLPPHMWASAPR